MIPHCPNCSEELSKESLLNLNWVICHSCENRFEIDRERSLEEGNLVIWVQSGLGTREEENYEV